MQKVRGPNKEVKDGRYK